MAGTVILRPVPPEANTRATFEVTFQGFSEQQPVKLQFVEHDADPSGDQILGEVTGKLVSIAGGAPGSPRLSLNPDPGTAAPAAKTKITIGFILPPKSAATTFIYDIPIDKNDQFEGTFWKICARALVQNASGLDAESPTAYVARVQRAIPVTVGGKATYPWHGGNDVTFYANGSHNAAGTDGAFHDIEAALKGAKEFIFIADWSFQPAMRLNPNSAANPDSTVGKLLIDLARNNPDMLIAINTWKQFGPTADDTSNDGGNLLNHLAGGKRPSNLLWRGSPREGVEFSHHQKYVLLDVEKDGRREMRGFFGGLDLTKGRWDWYEHPNIAGDPMAAQLMAQVTVSWPGTLWGTNSQAFDDWYNAEFGGSDSQAEYDLPRQTWHDIYAQILGPTVWDLIREFVGRWLVDPTWTHVLGDGSSVNPRVLAKFKKLFEDKLSDGKTPKFIQQWEFRPGIWSAQVYRSIVKDHWGSDTKVTTPAATRTKTEFQWTVSGDYERSIQDAYLQAIRQADRFIYIETQYFIGSGSKWASGRDSVANQIPEAIIARILDRIDKGMPFHAYVVMPMYPEGDLHDHVNPIQRKFEWSTVWYMIRTLYAKVGAQWTDYLSFYFPAQWHNLPNGPVAKGDRKERLRKNQRYMVYVHSKMMIVDDRYAIIGSANLNERSLAGNRDTEICVGLWPGPGSEEKCVDQLKSFRNRLWTEFLGTLPGDWESPEKATCAQALQSVARRNYIDFRNGHRTSGTGLLCNWPVDATQTNPTVFKVSNENDMLIPDAPDGGNDWIWWAPTWQMLDSTELAE